MKEKHLHLAFAFVAGLLTGAIIIVWAMEFGK